MLRYFFFLVYALSGKPGALGMEVGFSPAAGVEYVAVGTLVAPPVNDSKGRAVGLTECKL